MRFVSWFPLLVVLALPSAARAENSALAEVDCWFEAPAHVTVECYRLTVPETRDFDLSVGPGQTLSLPVAIIRAGKGARPDPVVYLAGGPGDGAWLDPDRVEWWWEFVANTEWPRQRDLILYDQRGSGLVEPRIDCQELEVIALDLLTTSDAALAAKLQREAAAACAKRLVEEGHNPGAYTSRDSAADLHDLFQALNVPAWNVYGLSYGTRLGLEYMRQYPDDIRSVILDSVIPPEAQFLEGDAAVTDRAFRMVFDACAQEGPCRIRYPDLGARLTALVQRLDAEPLILARPHPDGDGSVKIVVDGNFLIGRLFTLLYNRADIEIVPQVIDFYDRGVEAEIARDVDEYIADYLGRADFGDAMFLGVHCQEEVPFNDMAKALSAYRRYPLLAGLAVGGESESFAETCAAWRAALPPQPLRASDNEPVTSELPTLLLSGLYDPVTPPAFARMAAAHLVNSYYLEFDGIGHDVLGNDACANVIARDFLERPRSPPRNICLGASIPPDFAKPVR